MIVRWQHAVGFLILLVTAVFVAAEDQPPVPRFTIDQPLHFLKKDGGDVLLQPGTYSLKPTSEHQLRLHSETATDLITVEAVELPHDQELMVPVAGTLATDEDSVHVVLFLPEGKALDAVGSRSGVRARAGALTSSQLSQVQISPSTLKNLNETVRPMGSPPPPILGMPFQNAMVDNPDLFFNWRDGNGNPRATSFRLCLIEAGTICSPPDATIYPIRDQPSITGTIFYPTNGLPPQFHGKTFKWTVGACAQNPLQTQSLGSTQYSELCTYAPVQVLTWLFPPPNLTSPSNNMTLTNLTFTWAYGNTNNIDRFEFCLHDTGSSCGDPNSVIYKLKNPAARAHSLGSAFWQWFDGMTVNWTVGACNRNNLCQWSSPRTVRFPIPPGSFNNIRQIIENAKCTNCHGMASGNANYQEHVARGRFPANTDPTNRTVCANCHTQGNGFSNLWRAPSRYHNFSPGGSVRGCFEFRSLIENKSEMASHLKSDELVLWAIDRIPGLTRPHWHSLIDAWYLQNFRCPTEYPPGTFQSPWSRAQPYGD